MATRGAESAVYDCLVVDRIILWLIVNQPPVGKRHIAMGASVCLSVSLLARLVNHTSKLHEIFSGCQLWPWWLGPLLAAFIGHERQLHDFDWLQRN